MTAVGKRALLPAHLLNLSIRVCKIHNTDYSSRFLPVSLPDQVQMPGLGLAPSIHETTVCNTSEGGKFQQTEKSWK